MATLSLFHRSDIRVITDEDLPAELRSDTAFDVQITARFIRWCQDQGVFYYARPRQSFSFVEAEQLAIQAGCFKLLLEDMS